MTGIHRTGGRLRLLPLALAMGLAGTSSSALAAPMGDAGVGAGDEGSKGGGEDETPFWGGSSLSWVQSAPTQTVGIGQDYQSKNPTYEWALSVGPAFRLYKADDFSVSLGGDVSLFHEFTNSDSTTRRGEWLLGDIEVGTGLSATVYESGSAKTSLSLRLPSVSLPTSLASSNNGKIIGLGGSLGVNQSLPLLGDDASVFRTFSISASAGYGHTFTEAIVPTNRELQRIRLTPDGQSLPSDQLGSAAYAKHRASFTLGLGTSVTDRVSLDTGLTYSPVWKYTFDNSVEICTVTTGCIVPDRVENPQHRNVLAGFTVGVGVQVFDAMNLGLSYANAGLQLGPDGKRRLPFYSPSARFSLSVQSSFWELYKWMGGKDSKDHPGPSVAKR